jgi:hypothetical protein
MSHLSNVWFKVTDLQVASGHGCRVTTVDGAEYLDFAAGIAVNSTGHATRVVAAGDRRPGASGSSTPRSTSSPTTCSSRSRRGSPTSRPPASTRSSTPTPVPRSPRPRSSSPSRPPSARTSIVFQGSFHGRTHLAMAMTTSKTVYRAGHAPLPGGVFVAPFPDPLADDQDAEIGPALTAFDHLLLTETAPSETAAVILEPVLGEGGLRPGAGGVPPRGSSSAAASTASCSSPTRCRAASGAPADVRRRAPTVSSPTSSAWPRASRRVPVRRPRHAPRARRPLAEGQPRRHLRRQPDRLCRRAGHDRRDDRARFPRQRPNARGEQLTPDCGAPATTT